LALTTALGQTLSSTLNVVTTGNAATSDGQAVSTPTLLYQANFPGLVGADTLQNQGITGKGVTVAILDTGLYKDPMQNFGSRVLASVDLLNGSKAVTNDPYGHGTSPPSRRAGRRISTATTWALPRRPTWSSCAPSTARAPASTATSSPD
jgi:subtilisin family serine protease